MKRSASRTSERGGFQWEGGIAGRASSGRTMLENFQSQMRRIIQNTKKRTPSGRVRAAVAKKSGDQPRPRSETCAASARSKPAVTKNVNIAVSSPPVLHSANAEHP